MHSRFVAPILILVGIWNCAGCSAIGAWQGNRLDTPYTEVPIQAVFDSTSVGGSFRALTIGGLRVRGEIAGVSEAPSRSRVLLLYHGPPSGILTSAELESVDVASLERLEIRRRNADTHWALFGLIVGAGLDVGTYLVVRSVINGLSRAWS